MTKATFTNLGSFHSNATNGRVMNSSSPISRTQQYLERGSLSAVYDANGNIPSDIVSLCVALGRESRSMFMGWGDTGPEWASDRETVLALAGPQRGKTARFLIPSSAANPGPVVFITTRDEAEDALTAPRSLIANELGGYVVALDLLGNQETNLPKLAWDILDYCDFAPFALSQAELLASLSDGHSTKHWSDKAAAVLGPLMYASALLGTSPEQLASDVSNGRFELYEEILFLAAAGINGASRLDAGVDYKGALSILRRLSEDVEDHPNDHLPRSNEKSRRGFDLDPQMIDLFNSVMGEGNAGPEERMSILSTLSKALKQYQLRPTKGNILNPGAASESERWAISLEELTSTHSTIIVKVPSQGKAAGAVAAAFFRLFEEIWNLQAAQRSQRPDGPQTAFVGFDETNNTIVLPDIAKYLTAGAGNRFLVGLAVQSVDHAKQSWGANGGNVLVKTTTHRILLGGLNDYSYLTEAAALAGEEDVVVHGFAPADNLTAKWNEADGERLVIERKYLKVAEAKVNDVIRDNGMPTSDAIALRKLTRELVGRELWAARVADGLDVRRSFQEQAESMGHAVIKEVQSCTRLITTMSRRPRFTAQQLDNPPPDTAYFLGPKGISNRKFLHFRKDPYWGPMFADAERQFAEIKASETLHVFSVREPMNVLDSTMRPPVPPPSPRALPGGGMVL